MNKKEFTENLHYSSWREEAQATQMRRYVVGCFLRKGSPIKDAKYMYGVIEIARNKHLALMAGDKEEMKDYTHTLTFVKDRMYEEFVKVFDGKTDDVVLLEGRRGLVDG